MARADQHRRKPAATARRVRVRIEDIAAGGDGVGIVDGARIFAPLTAPGDLADIDLRGERGTLVDLIEKGPDRIVPPCGHYGSCGGCSLQHVTHGFYRDWKRSRLLQALAREGFDAAIVGGLIETPAATRRRARFAVKKLRGRALVGFNGRRSSTIEAVDDCLILHPGIATRLPALRALAMKIEAAEFDLTATLCDNGIDVAISAALVKDPRGPALSDILSLLRGADVVRLSVNGETIAMTAAPVVRFDGVPVTPPPGGFLQASREGEAALINLVKAAAAGARKVADLFSGCGTFALPLARAATVFAVDSDRASIDALLKAAAAAQGGGLNPLKAETRDLFTRPMTARELKGFDAIIFDPPRAGAAAQAREIAASGVGAVIGVSCNPASFARDAAILRQGGFTLSQAFPIDQFVYSSHVEAVGVFRKG